MTHPLVQDWQEALHACPKHFSEGGRVWTHAGCTHSHMMLKLEKVTPRTAVQWLYVLPVRWTAPQACYESADTKYGRCAKVLQSWHFTGAVYLRMGECPQLPESRCNRPLHTRRSEHQGESRQAVQ